MKNNEAKITTIIGRGAECDGNFSAEGSVRIDGTVNGDVTVTGSLTVGSAGIINGDVSAKSAMIGGEVIGNVTVVDKTELTGTAKVIGNISTTLIVIDENAVFQGSCNMDRASGETRQKPAGREVRAGKRSAKAAIEEALREVEAANQEEEQGESDQ